MEQFKFKTMNEAFNKAQELCKTNDYVAIIQSYDNREVVFYVETNVPFIRNFEKQEHEWIKGVFKY